MEPQTEDQFLMLYAGLNAFKTQIQELEKHLSTLEKQIKKDQKIALAEASVVQAPAIGKPSTKTKKSSSEFDTPETISEELAGFINMTVGKEISRTAASQQVVDYIRKNKLQDKTNPKRILPDESLTKLLRLQDVKEDVTFFNLHKYIHPHFV